MQSTNAHRTANRLALIALAGIMALSLWLHLHRIDDIGDANTYYTAAVESMLQSWHNFFFVAAEPGGSVTVDKPPLGLWIEAASAFILGVNGFAVVLPNILAGVATIPVLYGIVRKRYGAGAGLVAALAVAVMPVSIAAQRNNTMDGMLTFCLVLTAWAFLKATETGKLRYLWLGAALAGLGFNIKMLQAFVPLPAFYLAYFFGAQARWGRKFMHLALATLILIILSFAWPLAVDLTPASQRPYVGSSEDNTVTSLILGHNGLNRWLGRNALQRLGLYGNTQQPLGQTPPGNPPAQPQPPDNPPGQQTPPGAPPSQQTLPGNPPSQQLPPGNTPTQGNAPGHSKEVGDPGLLRFFRAPLSKELSWLLPTGLVAMLLLLAAARPALPLSADHRMSVIWGGWLCTGLVFFSVAEFFHAYYMIMLGPPLAALLGSGMGTLWRRRRERPWLIFLLCLAVCGGTLAFQTYNAKQFVATVPWLLPAALALATGMGVWLAGAHSQGRSPWQVAGLALAVLSIMAAPLAWSVLTVTQGADLHLPAAYDGTPKRSDQPQQADSRDLRLIQYLAAHTQDVDYLLAVPSSMEGADLVLATGRPVLYMGGFSGGDPVVTADDIAALVDAGELRYILLGSNKQGDQGIERWVQRNCTPVSNQETGLRTPGQGNDRSPVPTLFVCGG